MSKDIIYREDAIKAMEQRYQDILRIFKRKVEVGERAIALDMIGCIKSLPSADRPQGEWIDIGTISHSYKCSVCGRTLFHTTVGKSHVAEYYPYCHCGARMKGVDDE